MIMVLIVLYLYYNYEINNYLMVVIINEPISHLIAGLTHCIINHWPEFYQSDNNLELMTQ